MGEIHNPLLTKVRQQYIYPSLVTEHRWQDLVDNLVRYPKCRVQEIRNHLILCALCQVAFPKATVAKINAFLYRANYGTFNFCFYSPSQITKSKQQLGLTRKVGSTTAYPVLPPRNKQKMWCYWNLPYPYGIVNIRCHDLIDMDKYGIELSMVDCSIGKAYIGKRVKQSGLYSKSDKWTLLLAIYGNPNVRIWQKLWTEEGTTRDRMVSLLTMIFNQLGPGKIDRRFCFIMDNLNSHHNVQMSLLFFMAGHRLVFWAPYYLIDGPIEPFSIQFGRTFFH